MLAGGKAEEVVMDQWVGGGVSMRGGGGGLGGFFLVGEAFGRKFYKTFPACAFFCFRWNLARTN